MKFGTISYAHILFILATVSSTALAGLPMETESARLPAKGTYQAETAFEYQTSREGTEAALPMEFETGLTDQFALLVEPVPFTTIQPRNKPHATGIGDLELTLFYLSLTESERRPAIALAAEVKFPTAKSRLIGTGKADYTPYVIGSKKFGLFDVHINFGYTFMGQPNGQTVNDLFNYALGIEYEVGHQWELIAEVYGNTSSLSGRETEGEHPGIANSAVTPESAGNEVVGTVGARYLYTKSTIFSFGISYDNNDALLLRPGITVVF